MWSLLVLTAAFVTDLGCVHASIEKPDQLLLALRHMLAQGVHKPTYAVGSESKVDKP